MHELTLRIDGMSCGHCVRAVKQALEATSSVTVKHVDVGTATVEFDGRPESVDAIVHAIDEAGYTARPESEVHARSAEHRH
jgi:copper chaperone